MAKKIYSIVQTTALVILLVLAVGLVGMKFILHISPNVVVSGSMEPTVPTGSVAFIDEKDTDIEVNDIVAYRESDTMAIMHRVVGVNDEGQYIFKGDANDCEDFSPVNQSQIIGTEVFHIEKVGFLVQNMKTMKGLIIVVTCFVAFFLLGLMVNNSNDEKEEDAKHAGKHSKKKE